MHLRATLRQALRAAAAATLAMAGVELLGISSGIWAPLSALAGLQSQIGASLVAARNYIIASVTGVLLGGVLVTLFGDHLLVAGVGVFCIAALAIALRLPPAGAAVAAGVLPVLVLSVSGSPWVYGGRRIVEILVGLGAAILVSFVLFPSRAVVELRRNVAAALGDAGALAASALRALAEGRAPSGGDQVEARATQAIQAAQGLLPAARGEPLAAPVRDLLPFTIAHADRILEHAASVSEFACLPLPQPAVRSLAPALGETAAGLEQTVVALQSAVMQGSAGVSLPDVRVAAASLRASVDGLRGADLSPWAADSRLLALHSLLTALDALCREIERTIDRIEQPEAAVQGEERVQAGVDMSNAPARTAWWRRVRV